MENISKAFNDPQMTPELEKTLTAIKDDLKAPFIPNFFHVWGNALESLQGIFPAMKHILMAGSLDRKLKEMIILAISSNNNCDYCMATHQSFCTMMGVSEETITTLKTTYQLPESSSEKDQAAVKFAVQLSLDSKSGTPENIAELHALGFAKEDIFEIIAMSGMSVFYNHLANATQINIDDDLL